MWGWCDDGEDNDYNNEIINCGSVRRGFDGIVGFHDVSLDDCIGGRIY